MHTISSRCGVSSAVLGVSRLWGNGHSCTWKDLRKVHKYTMLVPGGAPWSVTSSLWSFTMKHNGHVNGAVVRQHEEMACVLCAQSRGMRTWSLPCSLGRSWLSCCDALGSQEPLCPLPCTPCVCRRHPGSSGLVTDGVKAGHLLVLRDHFLSPQIPLSDAANRL